MMADKRMRYECTHQVEGDFPDAGGRHRFPAAPSLSRASTAWRSSRALEKCQVHQRSPVSVAVSPSGSREAFPDQCNDEMVSAR